MTAGHISKLIGAQGNNTFQMIENLLSKMAS